MQEQEYEISIVVSNTHDTDVIFVLEPWGRTYEMPPQASYTVVFRSLVQPIAPNTIVVEYGSNSIVVYGWSGCLVDAYQNGKLIN